MKKKLYSPVQMILIGMLVICGISFLLSDNVFRWEEAGNPCTFSYIGPGEYVLDITCTPVDQANRVIVFSREATNAEGETGVVLAQADLEPGQESVSVPLSVEDGIYSVCVVTSLDTEDTALAGSAYLVSEDILYRDGAFLGVICLLTAAALLVIFVRLPREVYFMPVMAAVIGLLAGIPMYAEFILGGHDFTFHMLRIEGLYRAMASGDFPVRLNPLQVSGYGYLSSTMYPQWFIYPVALLRFLNVSVISCYKILLTMINVGTALIAYYAVKNITRSDKIGILMSFLYTFSAYRLMGLYVRCAIGEVLAMTFFPLVIWGVYECLWGGRRWIILTLGITGVLESHILSAEICALFMILELLWWLFGRKKDHIGKRIMAGVKAVLAAVLLNLSFLVPFLYFSTHDLVCFQMTNSAANSVVYFSQMFSLFLSKEGVSVSRGTTVNEMSLTVGTALLVGLGAFVLWSGSGKEREKVVGGLGVHCAVYALTALYLSSWLMPWSAVILRSSIIDRLTTALQFVWRFLGMASLFMALCSAIGIVRLAEEKREWSWLVGVVVTLCLITTWSLFDDLKGYTGQNNNPMSAEAVLDVDELYLYNGIDSKLYTRETAVPRTAGGTPITCSEYRKQGTHISMHVESGQAVSDSLLFPLFYYPGYEIRINGEKVTPYGVDWLLACDLPAAPADVQVRYRGLPIFRVCDMISLLAGIGILFLIIKRGRKITIDEINNRMRLKHGSGQ